MVRGCAGVAIAGEGVDVRFPPVLVGAGWHCGRREPEQHDHRRGGGARRRAALPAAVSKDPRFDGWFFTAVTSTGIYCRPSCPAITPKRANMRFYPSAAAAQEAGFRACKRCRPDAAPGSPEWNVRADVVGRAMRLIADGVVDRDGVAGLARRLGYSSASCAGWSRRAGRRPARPRPRAARADGADADRDHRAAALRGRLRGRLRQHPAVQRHRPRGLRGDADRAAPGARRGDDPAARRRPQRTRAPGSIRAPARPSGPRSTASAARASWAPGPSRGRGGARGPATGGPRLPHGPGICPLAPGAGYVDCELRLERPARPDRRGAALPPAARPRRRPGRGRPAAGGRPGARAAGLANARPALARARRRRRAGAAGGAGPAGLGGRRPHARRRGWWPPTASRCPRPTAR